MFSALIKFLLLSFFMGHHNPLAYNENVWRSAADYLSEAMDTRADPCEDFYQFACGNWKKKYGDYFVHDTQHLQYGIKKRIGQAIIGIKEDDPRTPAYQKLLKESYHQCSSQQLNATKLTVNFYRKMESILGPMPLLAKAQNKRLRGSVNRLTAIGQLKRVLNFNGFIQLDTEVRVENCVSQPFLVLRPSPLSGDTKIDLTSKSLTEAVKGLGRMLNLSLDNNQTLTRMNYLVKLRKRYSDHIRKNADETSASLSNITQRTGTVLEDYFRGLLPPDALKKLRDRNPIVFVTDMEYFKQLTRHLSRINDDDFFDSLHAIALVQARALMESKFNFGASDEDMKKEVCLKNIMKTDGASCARLLIDNTGTDIAHWKHDIELIAETVFASTSFLVQTADWLDLENRLAFIDKLNAMRIQPGIPEWILGERAVDQMMLYNSTNASVLESEMQINERRLLRKFTIFDQRLSMHDMQETLFEEPDFEPNAYYSEQVILLALAEVLPPRYNYFYPLALKYGQLGWTIGHELFHGFDYQNVKKATKSTRKLSPAALEHFRKLVNCLRRQYSGVCFGDSNVCISGTKTMDDNIADIEGLKTSYMAYKFMLHTSGQEPRLPGSMANYSEDQLFFISMARPWCGLDEVTVSELKTDEHSPARARVEVPIMNFPIFAETFHCPVGSVYAPFATCNLWGDFLGPAIDKKKRK